MKSKSEKRFILFIATVFYMCMTVMAAPAQGDDKTGAKKHFDAGLSLLEAEDFAGAAAEFDASVKLFPTKNGLFNLANCLKALHQYDEALVQVARLKELFANNLDAELKAVVAKLEAEIRAVVAELTIQVDPAGALVTIDGREVGRGPLAKPVLLGPGEHVVVVSSEGRERVERKLNLVSGAKREELFVLEPSYAELSVTANISGAAITVDGEAAGRTPLEAPIKLSAGEHSVALTSAGYLDAQKAVTVKPGQKLEVEMSLAPAGVLAQQAPVASQEGRAEPVISAEAREDKGGLSTLSWVGIVATASAAIATGVVWGLAMSKYGDYKDQSKTYNNNTGNVDEWNKLDQLSKDTSSLQSVAIGLSIGAGVLAVATAVVMAIDLSSTESQERSVTVAPDGIAVRF
jgi:hypothetical protein